MEPSQLSQESEMDALFADLAGQHVLYRPNTGNAGDSAINCAAYALFRRHDCSFKVVPGQCGAEETEGRTVLYGGGGNLIPLYDAASKFIERHHEQCRRLIVLPHTIRGHETLIARLGGNVTLCCRDKESYSHVLKHGRGVHAVLTHDLAFGLDPAQILDEGRKTFWPALSSLGQSIWNVKRGVLGTVYRLSNTTQRKQLNAFRKDEESGTVRRPVPNIDVSGAFAVRDMSPTWALETTWRVLEFLNTFDRVHTDRLHIGILSTLLGKDTTLYDNSYGKNRAIFEHSMRGRWPNVSLRVVERSLP